MKWYLAGVVTPLVLLPAGVWIEAMVEPVRQRVEQLRATRLLRRAVG